MRLLLSGFAAAVAATGFAQAQNYSNADEIVIRDLFGTVTIELSDGGPVTIAKSGPGAGDVDISGSGTATIEGPEEINRREFQREYNKLKNSYRGRRAADEDPALEEMLEEKPSITISVPRGTDIRVDDSVIKLTASGDAGEVMIKDNLHVLVKMGDIESGQLGVHGSGYMKVGDVAESLRGSVHGSGDLLFGDAGSAKLSVHGSGDLEGGDIAGDLEASVHGSGDLEIADVGGEAEAKVHGSGDLVVASIEGGLDGSVHGSGDLTVGEVQQSLNASVHGSGDFDVDAGEVDELLVSVHGSGEFQYGGSAKTAKLNGHGSGSIRVAEVSGNMQASGKDIRVGGKKVGRKDD